MKNLKQPKIQRATTPSVTPINQDSINSGSIFGGLVISVALFSHAISSFLPITFNFIHLFSPILLGICASLYRRIPAPRAIPFAYIFLIYWSLLVVLSMYITSGYSTLLQLSIFLFMPTSLLIVGYHTSKRFLRYSLTFSTILICLFTILERLSFSSTINSGMVESISLAFRMQGLSASDVVLFGRATGIFGNPNELGLFSVCAFFSIWYLGNEKRLTALNLLVFFLLIATLLLSSSRGSIASFVAGIALLTLVNLKSKSSWISSLLICIFLYFIFKTAFLTFDDASNQLLLSRLSSGSGLFEDENLSGRRGFWVSVLRSEYITFGTIQSPEMVFGHAIDNMFIRVLAQGGLIGFSITALLLINVFWIIIHINPIRQRGIAFAFGMAFSLNAMTMLGFQSVVGMVFFWTMFGVFLADVRKQGAAP